jgi:flagellar biosynthesis/type III secretory pathway M-ring protein FliF/YscJ
VLGDVFLRNYYLILDYEQKRVGLASNFYSEDIISWNGISIWVVGSMILIWVLILLGVTFYVCHYRKNRNKKEKENDPNNINSNEREKSNVRINEHLLDEDEEEEDTDEDSLDEDDEEGG